MDKVLSKLKAKCAETNKDIEEKKKSRPLANSAEVYELIGSDILEDESMLEYLSERVSFLDLIIQVGKDHGTHAPASGLIYIILSFLI